ncbi:MAG: amidohydrolase family protein, partial [Actinobacteria bacterium]|nr:amidohydrolase family protein [Actinomycetota bacterium]
MDSPRGVVRQSPAGRGRGVLIALAVVAAGCSGTGPAGDATTVPMTTPTTASLPPTTSLASTTTSTSAPAATATTTAPTTTTATTRSPDPAALVLRGGPIHTMVPGSQVAGAIAVDGERIVAVGTEAEVAPWIGPDTVVVDLEGRAVLPGLIDGHGHWISDDHLMGFAAGEAGASARFAAASGITTIYDTFVRPDDLAELLALDRAGQLPVRVSVYFPFNFLTRDYGMWFGDYTPGEVLSPHVRVGGAKLFMDPTDPAGMFLSEPHAGRPGYRGEVVWAQEELDAVVAALDAAGWQIAVHTGGDGALDMILDAYAAALDGGPNELRHRVEHAAVIRDDQIERLRALGIIASIQTTWFHSDWIGDPHWGGFPAALGPERIGWAGRWRDLLDAGVTMAGGTDTPWNMPVSVGGIA